MPRILQLEGINSSSNITFSTGATIERLRIDSSGNVGIGTDNPVSKLHIKDGTNFNLLIRQQASKLQFFSATDAYGTIPIDFLATSYAFNYGAGNVNALTINSSGNVGIGTASPVSVLDISKASDTSERAIKVQNSSCDLFVGVEGTSANRFVGSSANNAFLGTTSAAGIEFATNNTVRVKIDSSGNVGVGTISPLTKLDVRGVGYVSQLNLNYGVGSDGNGIINGGTNLYLRPQGGALRNDTGPTYLTGGNVGIGTESPIDQLSIGGTGRINFGGSVVTDITAGIYFHTAGSTAYAIHRTAGAWTANTYQQLRMSFDTGIVLDSGTAYDKSFVRVDGTGIRVASGNIGIGTTTKALTHKLEINGSNWTDCCRINASSTSGGIDFWDTSSGTLARKGVLYTNSEGFGLLNSAAGWALRVTHNSYDVVIPNGSLALGKDIITNANYGYGHVGVYSESRFQSVFAMGTPFTMKADGTSLSAGAGGNNFYGIAWSYPSVGGQGANLNNHGALFVVNGATQTAISSSIWCIGNITAYSDERVKTNWRNLDNNFVEKLAKVKSGIFDRTDVNEKENGFKTQVGVSAQSLKEVIPNAVTCNVEGMLSVSYGNAAMVSCVELAKEILKLKEEIEILKNK